MPPARLPRGCRAPVAEAKRGVEGVVAVLGPAHREVVCAHPRCRLRQLESEGYPIQRADSCIQSKISFYMVNDEPPKKIMKNLFFMMYYHGKNKNYVPPFVSYTYIYVHIRTYTYTYLQIRTTEVCPGLCPGICRSLWPGHWVMARGRPGARGRAYNALSARPRHGC